MRKLILGLVVFIMIGSASSVLMGQSESKCNCSEYSAIVEGFETQFIGLYNSDTSFISNEMPAYFITLILNEFDSGIVMFDNIMKPLEVHLYNTSIDYNIHNLDETQKLITTIHNCLINIGFDFVETVEKENSFGEITELTHVYETDEIKVELFELWHDTPSLHMVFLLKE